MFHYHYVLMDCFLLLLICFFLFLNRRYFFSFLQHVPSRVTWRSQDLLWGSGFVQVWMVSDTRTRFHRTQEYNTTLQGWKCVCVSVDRCWLCLSLICFWLLFLLEDSSVWVETCRVTPIGFEIFWPVVICDVSECTCVFFFIKCK